MYLEENLKLIKDAKLDIELLRRKNETECAERNAEIIELQKTIEQAEEKLETDLRESGEKKVECKLGWCSFRVQPDKWEYMDSDIIDWCKAKGVPYFHTVEVVEKMKLKKAILSNELKLDEVTGLTVTPQEPKFNYKLNGGL